MNNKRLKELRLKAEKTQTELATDLGFSVQRYNYYENGKNQPDNESLIKIANYFGVSADYLLGISDEPSPYQSTHLSLEGTQIVERTYYGDIGKTELKKTTHPSFLRLEEGELPYNEKKLLETFRLLDEANQHLILSKTLLQLGEQEERRLRIEEHTDNS